MAYLYDVNKVNTSIFNEANIGNPVFRSHEGGVTVYKGFKVPHIKWLVDGFIREQGFHVLYGATGTMKSYTTLDLAMRLVNGMDEWNGHKIEPSEVLVVIGEGLQDYRVRMDAWKIMHNKEDEPYCILQPTMFTSFDAMSGIEDFIRWTQNRVKLVIFDTLSTMASGIKVMDNDDVNEKLATPLLSLSRRTGVATLLVHHTGHDKAYERGASAIRDHADVSVHVSKNGLSVTLEVVKRRHGLVGDKIVFMIRDVSNETGIPHAAILEPIGGKIAKIGTAASKTVLEGYAETIYTIIAEYVSGIKQSEVVSLSLKQGVPRSEAYKAIKLLINKDAIEEANGVLVSVSYLSESA